MGQNKRQKPAGATAEYEFVWMKRNAELGPSLSQDMTLDGFDYESAGRYTLAYFDNEVTGVELIYMGELDSSTAGTITAPVNTFADSFIMNGDIQETDLATFGLASQHHQSYRPRLQATPCDRCTSTTADR